MFNRIVPYQEEYHDHLVDIWYRAVALTHTFLSEEDLQFYHRIVRGGALKEVEIWVEANDEYGLVGFIGLDGAKIEMLFVDPDCHGKGTGSRLIKHAADIRGGQNLQVDVNEQNDRAVRFYSKMGFVRTGRSELDGTGRLFPLLHMCKE